MRVGLVLGPIILRKNTHKRDHPPRRSAWAPEARIASCPSSSTTGLFAGDRNTPYHFRIGSIPLARAQETTLWYSVQVLGTYVVSGFCLLNRVRETYHNAPVGG